MAKLGPVKVPTPGTARSLVMNPHRALRSESTRVPASILLFAGLVALASWRRGRLPKDQEWIPLLIAAVVVVLVANVAPEPVTWLLIAAVVITLLQNADGISQLVAMGSARFQQALGAAA